MNEEVSIRKARESDFEDLRKLVMQVHEMHVKERYDIYKDIEPLNLEDLKEDLLDENNIYLVAELNKKAVGLCFAQIKEISNNKIMKDRTILNINDICVDKDCQNRGIGKSLYNQIFEIGKSKNIDSVELMVWSFNKNAIKFYEKIGMNIKNLRFEQKIQ